MGMPNFLIIGAAKAGTTALHNYLMQHPEVYMTHPIKEPRFFAYEDGIPDFQGPITRKMVARASVTDPGEYEVLFGVGSGKRATGESSTLYLYYPGTAERIRRRIPDSKLIAVLRQPVDRAYSNFMHLRRDGLEPESSFEGALRQEQVRIRDNWAPALHYRQTGFYYVQLSRYYDLFDPSQIRVYLYEDFKTDPVAMVQDICRFLDVDDRFVPDTSLRHNPSGIPKSKVLQGLISRPNGFKDMVKALVPESAYTRLKVRLQEANLRDAPSLTPATRAALNQDYREDILRLQDLIGRDLTAWLK